MISYVIHCDSLIYSGDNSLINREKVMKRLNTLVAGRKRRKKKIGWVQHGRTPRVQYHDCDDDLCGFMFYGSLRLGKSQVR